MKDKNCKKEIKEEELEKIFDATWENWGSRRRCEKTHTPEFIKRIKEKKNNPEEL